MDPIKVLVADDETDILELMEKKITQAGYTVVTAQDGEEAWEKIKSESPDVIVLDLTMPKKDGLEILKNLRDDPPTAKWQPVIIVSARNELKDFREGMGLEADHYLTKPCRMEDILKAVRLMAALIPLRVHNSH